MNNQKESDGGKKLQKNTDCIFYVRYIRDNRKSEAGSTMLTKEEFVLKNHSFYTLRDIEKVLWRI